MDDACEHGKRRFALLLHNRETGISGEIVNENLLAMKTVLQASSYEVVSSIVDYESEERVYSINLGSEDGRGFSQIRNFVGKHGDNNDCCEEILVYFSGDVGVEQSRNGPKAYIETEFAYRGETMERATGGRIYSEDLVNLLKGLKTCHLNIVFDCNHAAGLAEDLLELRNVETIVASSQLGEYAYSGIFEAAGNGSLLDPYGKEQGETGSEFTSGFAKGINDAVISPPVGDDALSAYQVVVVGTNAALKNDIAYLGGVSHPFTYTRSESPDCGCSVTSN